MARGAAVADVTAYFGHLANAGVAATRTFALALHGGASDLAAASGERRRAFEAQSTAFVGALLAAGRDALARGASALDVVQACVCAMEDSGTFNAGRGATRNRAGDVQLDAAVMFGRDARAGAVAAIRHLRNPVAAARLVMERSPHVLLVGADAERFAVDHGAESVASDWFTAPGALAPADADTVGAVALDVAGDLAAATSTGGIAGKLPGRVGDSPLIGAGTYADNGSVAVSATGQGEYFMRLVLAYEVAALVRHAGLPLAEAARRTIHERLTPAGGRGGLIAVERSGTVAMAQNAAFMPRGWVTREEAPRVLFSA